MRSGSGTFNQTAGSVQISRSLVIGNFPAATGTYNLSDGSLSVSKTFGEVVGLWGNGTFVQSGGIHSTGTLTLGSSQGSTGTYNLSAGTLSFSGGLCNEYIGYQGAATFTQSGGSHSVNGTGTNGLFLGYNPGSTGIATLSGGTLSVISSEYVGYRGKATFTQSAGTHTIGSSLVLSANPGTSTGTFKLQGGYLSAAALQINSGGSLTQTGGILTVNGPATNQAALSLLAGTSSLGPLSGTGSLTIGSPSGTPTASATLARFSQSTVTIDSTGVLTTSPNTPRATNTASVLVINPGGALDLTRNDLLVDRTLTPPATVRPYLVSGYANNAWNGPGIRSSLAQGPNADTFALGWADGGASPGVAGLLTNQVLIRYTRQGDANLDLKTDILDFGVWRNHTGGAGNWVDGDLNYDGTVNVLDFGLWRDNTGFSAP